MDQIYDGADLDNLSEYITKKADKFCISRQERDVIESQLDNQADNALAVIKRCSAGFPQVLLVHPFYEGMVLPTIFWLSCPELSERIFQLEDQGLLEELTRREREHSSFSQKMNLAHAEYARCRRKLMKEEHWQQAASISEDIVKTLENSGAGGIRTSTGLKCLHTHYAHYVVGGRNPAGRITAERLSPTWLCRRCYRFS